MVTKDWVKVLRKENKKLVQQATTVREKAMYNIQMAETLHRQSREAWGKGSVELEAQNKKYLVTINYLFTERDRLNLALDTVSVELKGERDTALVVALQLRKENIILRVNNYHLKEEAIKAFNDAKEAPSEVIDTSKT